MLSEGESPMNFYNHINSVCFKNRYERGYSLSMKGNSVSLPLPFPRIFSQGMLTENGMIKPEEDRAKDDFVMQVPMMTRLA